MIGTGWAGGKSRHDRRGDPRSDSGDAALADPRHSSLNGGVRQLIRRPGHPMLCGARWWAVGRYPVL
jgi:hypothetical protein